jgi:p-methyltransferase
MRDGARIDCVIVGYHEIDFKDQLEAQRALASHSGGYRNLRANSLLYHGERITYIDLLNRSIARATDSDSSLNVFRLPNLAVCYLNYYLARRNLATEIVNFFSQEQDWFRELLLDRPRSIAITTTFYVDDEPVKEIVRFVRAHSESTKVIVGGPHIFNVCRHLDESAQNYLFHNMGADVYVNDAQGEATLAALVSRLREAERPPLHDIPNLAVADGAGFLRTPRVPEDNRLDDNCIDWRAFDAEFVAPTCFVRTARSCAFKCSFCNFPLMAGPLALAGADAVEREFSSLHAVGVRNLIFIDDTFNVPLGRFKDLCRLLIRNNYGFNWYSMFRCSNADDEAFDLMARSGCRGVFLGIESGSQAVLDNMEKGAKVPRYEVGIRKLSERGITTLASFIIGFPGETGETVRESIQFIERCKPTFYRAQLYYHDVTVPIQARAREFALRGGGYSWSHRTMDWREAADWVDSIYNTIHASKIFPAHGLDLESIAYLDGQGVGLPKVEAFARIAQDLLVQSLDDMPRDCEPHEDSLTRLFAPGAGDRGGAWRT